MSKIPKTDARFAHKPKAGHPWTLFRPGWLKLPARYPSTPGTRKKS